MTVGEIEALAASRGLVNPRVVPFKERGGNVKLRLLSGEHRARRVVAEWPRGEGDDVIRQRIEAVAG